MTFRYILVQLIGLCGTLLFFFSYQCKSNRRLFQVQFASYVFYTAHLLLLGAVTGGISYVINTFRSFCLGAKWKFGKSRAMCALICLAQLLALALTWGGWISILPVAANIATNIAVYTHFQRKLGVGGMFFILKFWMV